MPASSLQTLVALAAVADAFSPAAAQTKPRHLVLIVADDLGYADLGYTGSEIRTPNIDGLARSGVDMRMHICTYAVAPQPPYVARGVRVRLGGLVARAGYPHQPPACCTCQRHRATCPMAPRLPSLLYRATYTLRTVAPPGEQRGEARPLLRPARVQPDACGAADWPVQHPSA